MSALIQSLYPDCPLTASGPNRKRHRIAICPLTDRVHLLPDDDEAGHDEAGETNGASMGKALGFAPVTFKRLWKAIGAKVNAGPTIRWITMHPHPNERGVPVRIVENHDKSWSVAGGAGGTLNGLRLNHVKSPHEYKALETQRRQAKSEKQQKAKADHLTALKTKHADALRQSNKSAPAHEQLSDEHIEGAAHRAALEEQAQMLAGKKEALSSVSERARAGEREQIEAAAKAQGWDVSADLPEEVENEIRDKARERVLQENPDLHKALQQDDAAIAGRAARKVNALVEKEVNRAARAYHGALLSHARGVQGNLRDQIRAAHDDRAADTLGEVPLNGAALSDVVQAKSSGDATGGYNRDARQHAAAQGIDADDLADSDAVGDAVGESSNGADEEPEDARAAREARTKERADKAREAAADYDAILASHGLSPSTLAGRLDLSPNAQNTREAADALVAMKKGEDAAKQARQSGRDIQSEWGDALHDKLGELPKTAVVAGEELSDDDARQQVIDSIMGEAGEAERQRAVTALLSGFNAQDAAAPLVKHRLGGHNNFWEEAASSLGQALGDDGVNLRSPDPLEADILGASGVAHVMRRAIEQSLEGKENRGELLGRVRDALSSHHVDKQVSACDHAVKHANGLLDQAETARRDGDVPPADDDELLARIEDHEDAARLTARAREALGFATGRLEAGAALNDALRGSGHYGDGKAELDEESHGEVLRAGKKDVQISLGAISNRDAHAQAGALGLSRPDQSDARGQVTGPGQYRIITDGHNQILCLHDAGVDTLARRMHVDPQQVARNSELRAIKDGAEDEADYYAPGFSKRKIVDVARRPLGEVPRQSFDFNGGGLSDDPAEAQSQLESRLKHHIGERMEAGQDALDIAPDLNSYGWKADHVDAAHHGAFDAALENVMPPLRHVDGQKTDADKARAHAERVRALGAAHHEEFLDNGGGDGGARSSQSLFTGDHDHDNATRDVLYQAALQDPRLPYAYTKAGELDKDGKAALRDYAMEHVFGVKDAKDRDAPAEALSPSERKAFDGWRDLKERARKEGRDPHELIQDHLREHEAKEAQQSGGGLFDDFEEAPKEEHPFASVDLNDDAAVVEAAKARPRELGYEMAQSFDSATGRLTETPAVRGKDGTLSPVLETSPEVPLSRVAVEARARIKSALRAHAMEKMHGVNMDDVRGNFHPGNVSTVKSRWKDYVRDTRVGQSRAYENIAGLMRGDLTSRLQSGLSAMHGRDGALEAAPVKLAGAKGHARALKTTRDRQSETAQQQSELAQNRNRAGGKFAREDESVADKAEAARVGGDLENRLLAGGAGAGVSTSAYDLATHRLSPGGRVESELEREMPGILHGRSVGATTAGRADSSQGEEVKRQRAVKLALKAKRLALSLGVGTGKTSAALGLHGELKAKNSNHRTLMVVPSNVQKNFGSEAARFFDPQSPLFPKWHADPSASPDERRAAYADPSVDIGVVTHAGLREDLNWALANSPATVARFDGDMDKARAFLEHAPQSERTTVLKSATDSLGWKHDLVVADESQGFLNRAGKKDSGMANAFDAFTAPKENLVTMSGDPSKNDWSENHDLLKKIAPDKYVDDDSPLAGTAGVTTQSEFKRRYGINSEASRLAMAREMEPYQYAEKIDPKARDGSALPLSRRVHSLPLSPAQAKDYAQATRDSNRLKTARITNKPQLDAEDLEAARRLSPATFHGLDEEHHKLAAHEIMKNPAMAERAHKDRIVNNHEQGVKMAMLDKTLGLPEDATLGVKHADLPHVDGASATDKPTVVFAHSLPAVDAIKRRLEARGLRVGTLHGGMGGDEKEKARQDFSPAWDGTANGGKGGYVTSPKTDVFINSDAGAAGANLQRGTRTVHWDSPPTAMTYEQRLGRTYRTGQRGDEDGAVEEHSFVTDTPYEKRRRALLEKKQLLREAVTMPHQLLDDGDLAERLRAQSASAR